MKISSHEIQIKKSYITITDLNNQLMCLTHPGFSLIEYDCLENQTN